VRELPDLRVRLMPVPRGAVSRDRGDLQPSPDLHVLLRAVLVIWDLALRVSFGPPFLTKDGRSRDVDGRRAELAKVRERDPRALDHFFHEHFDRVFSFAARLLGDRAAAEDVAQEVFFRAYRALDQLDLERDPAPWLLAITTNVCRDLWRSHPHHMDRRSEPLVYESGAERDIVDPSPDAQTARLKSEQVRLVQSALNMLPEMLREVVLLRDYQDLPHEDIAECLGISSAAARKRYSRALSQLAQLLSAEIPS